VIDSLAEMSDEDDEDYEAIWGAEELQKAKAYEARCLAILQKRAEQRAAWSDGKS